MTLPSPTNPGVLNWLLIIILGVIWGSAFMSMAVALTAFGPLSVAAIRVLVGAVALVVLGAAIGQPVSAVWRDAGQPGVIYSAIIGVITVALPFTLLTYGLQQVPSAFAGVAMGALPILLVPLVWMFSPDEGIGPRRIIGVVLGFVGLALLVGPNEASGGTTFGKLAVFGAVLSYAVGSVITRRAPKMPPVSFAAASLVIGAVIIVPAALVSEGIPTSWPVRETATLIYLGLLPTGIAAIIRIRVITTAGSLFMSFVNYMVPIWSVIFGIVLLGENLPSQLYLALAIILAGIAIAQWRSIAPWLGRKSSNG